MNLWHDESDRIGKITYPMLASSGLRAKELVEERTKGDIVINVFPNGQLGTGERDLIEGLQLGTVEMYLGSTGPMAGFEKKFLLFDFPFLFKNKKHVYAVLDGEIGTYILGLLDKLGRRQIGRASCRERV